jgi:hypothetical protein
MYMAYMALDLCAVVLSCVPVEAWTNERVD